VEMGNYKENYICDYPYRRIRLDQSGDVFACLVGMEHRLGHALEKSIEEMWSSDYMNNLRSSHLTKGASKTPGCIECGRQWEAK